MEKIKINQKITKTLAITKKMMYNVIDIMR